MNRIEPPDRQRGRYVEKMVQAVDFTRRLGFTRRRGFAPSPPMIEPDFSEILREWARINICPRPDDRIAGMCMQITRELAEFMVGAGIDAIYTLGWMSYHDHAVYKFTQADVRRWLVDGVPDRQKLDMHAWITLPSGEIIDPSWLSTVGIVRQQRGLIGAVITAHPDQSTSHQYHPVIVDLPIVLHLSLLHRRSLTEGARQATPNPEVVQALV